MAPFPPPLEGPALIKEVCRRTRLARSHWDAHRNGACRHEREKALALYAMLTPEQKEQVPQSLRVWLRYRSEKYFGSHQTPPGERGKGAKQQTSKSSKASRSKRKPR